jgi:phosphoenolpyruvate-protein kinase (PTS system EI component)
VCGGLAADTLAAPILIGLGISELSVPPPVIPRLKAAIRRLNGEACRTLARAALDLETPEAVRALVKANFVEEDR